MAIGQPDPSRTVGGDPGEAVVELERPLRLRNGVRSVDFAISVLLILIISGSRMRCKLL